MSTNKENIMTKSSGQQVNNFDNIDLSLKAILTGNSTMSNDEPKRRLLLPSLNPQGRKPLSRIIISGSAYLEEDKIDENQTNSSASVSALGTLQTGSSYDKSISKASTSPVAALESVTSVNKHVAGSSEISYRKERVLRYGETIESLFCLGSNVSSYHLKLCEDICSGEKGNDAIAWREVLMHVIGREMEIYAGAVDVGRRLINLHRRATSRFKLVSGKINSYHDEVLMIWLLYAAVQLKYDTVRNAVNTYKHIQRIYFINHQNAFYSILVESDSVSMKLKDSPEGQINNELEERLSLLRDSLQKGLSLAKLIEQQMNKLQKSSLLQLKAFSTKGLIELPPLLTKSQDGGKFVSVSQTISAAGIGQSDSGDKERVPPSEQSLEADNIDICASHLSIKRDSMNSSCRQTKRKLQNKLESSTDDDSINFSIRKKIELKNKSKPNSTISQVSGKRPSREVKSIKSILSQNMNDETDTDDGGGEIFMKSQITIPSDHISPKQTTDDSWPDKNISLMAAPDSVEAKRHFKEDISPIDEDRSVSIKEMDLGYLLSWDPTKRSSIKRKVSGTGDLDGKKSCPPKITRNDLGYMMNWEPFPKFQKDDNDSYSAGITVKRSSHSQVRGNMSKIEEEATEASLTASGDSGGTAQSGSTASSRDSGSKYISRAHQGPSNERNVSPDTQANYSSASDENGNKSTILDKSSESKVDYSFLPLIEKNNIIRVNNEPFAKLGIIGKGGSCKVYRALSRGCDVVALKKVRLDGLNKAAIDGYANEIALLQKMKGNPAIIQLFSSEVDLERKSIFLVMELGEVDLNYVLRQQELLSFKQGKERGKSSLNMNFIRLTWQQMLTAVHSIHEERIIHSDLKPANFLFVRGALKLIDFGIAKAIEREDTTNVYRETLSGTLSYMSPEAIMDTSTNAKGVRVNKCGRASDIWSLGCILYQMVYGKTPFADCQGIPQKVLAITNVNHVIDFPDGVDESAIDAMKLCLERNPKLRATIVGMNGLLNEHCFLHSRTKCDRK